MMVASIQGTEVPVLGLGTWELRGSECRRAVEHALQLGYRHIDTAQSYENEEEIGRVLASSTVPREEVFVTTKIWIGGRTASDVRRISEESLTRMRVDYIDLLLIHWPTEDMDLPGALGAMMEMREAGQIRHIGVSNFSPSLLQRALRYAPIFCNQVEYHPYLAQDELVAIARRHDLMLTAYSPVAKGAIIGDEQLEAIGRNYGKSSVQIALRWLIQQENVTTVPKAAREEHRVSNMDIFDFALTDDEMETISSMARDHRTTNPEWAKW